VQHKGALLATLALDTQDVLDAYASAPPQSDPPVPGFFFSLATNVVLPLDASEWHLMFPNGSEITFGRRGFLPDGRINTSFALDLPINTTIAVRVSTGGLALKVFISDGAGGQSGGRMQLKGEPKGMAVGAVRLACYHFVAPNSSKPVYLKDDTAVRFGAIMIADSVDKASPLAHLAQRVHGTPVKSYVASRPSAKGSTFDEWFVEAVLDEGTTMTVGRNLTCSQGGLYNQSLHTQWNCLTKRLINGSNIVPTTLTINNKPWPVPGSS
jgi:hypothetical protein